MRIETDVLDPAGAKIAVEGMGIPRGVTVLTGGGFHGKTTLLEALVTTYPLATRVPRRALTFDIRNLEYIMLYLAMAENS